MTYNENDPDRLNTPIRTQVVRNDSTGWIVGVLAVLAVVALIYALLPTSNEQAPRVTENAPRTERPINPTPPSMTPPTPTPPAEKPAVPQ
jgi:hypothetical protein